MEKLDTEMNKTPFQQAWVCQDDKNGWFIVIVFECAPQKPSKAKLISIIIVSKESQSQPKISLYNTLQPRIFNFQLNFGIDFYYASSKHQKYVMKSAPIGKCFWEIEFYKSIYTKIIYCFE